MNDAPPRSVRHMAVVAVLLALAACQAPPTVPAGPPQAPAALSEQQKRVLLQQGFESTDVGWELLMSSKLLFDVGSDVLDATSRANVAAIGAALHGAAIDAVRVEGHTDDQGSERFNEQLSLRRARTVAQVLMESGLTAKQLTVVGLGSTRPVVTNASEAARKENRRVAIIVPTN